LQQFSLWRENLTGLQSSDCSNVIYVAKSVFGIDHVKNLSGLDLKLELLGRLRWLPGADERA
jgi:hypothetical protein